MLDLLISAELFGAGGTETHLLNLCRLLRSADARITLATRYANNTTPLLRHLGELRIAHVTTPFAHKRELWAFSALWSYIAWPFQLDCCYDALYTFGVGRCTRFLARFVRPGGRVIWHPNGNPHHLPARMQRMPHDLVDAVIAESTVHEEVIRANIRGHTPVTVLPNLPQTEHVHTLPRRVAADQVRIAFLGRYDENKGVTRLLRVWPRLGIAPARLDFYGQGPLRKELETIVLDQRLENVTIHDGWSGYEQLGAILSRTDLVVLPSASEGIPLVLLEAMAHGIPFVAFDVGAVKVLAEGNPDVRVVPLDDVSFTHAVEGMVASIRGGSIDNARLQQYYEQRFGFEVASERWRSFFSDRAA
jgi:glycosyltransferase involved in cell wall biosynthesis